MTPLTDERLAELRRLAEAATPGPWAVREGTYAVHQPQFQCWIPQDINDAEYQAAVDPQTVLELLDALEAARRELAVFRDENNQLHDNLALLHIEAASVAENYRKTAAIAAEEVVAAHAQLATERTQNERLRDALREIRKIDLWSLDAPRYVTTILAAALGAEEKP